MQVLVERGQAQTAGVDQQTGDAGVDQAPVEGDQRLLVQLKQVLNGHADGAAGGEHQGAVAAFQPVGQAVQGGQHPLAERRPGFLIVVFVALPAAQRLLETGLEGAARVVLFVHPAGEHRPVLGLGPVHPHQGLVVVFVEAGVGGPFLRQPQCFQRRLGGFPVTLHGAAHHPRRAQILLAQMAAEDAALFPAGVGQGVVVLGAETGLAVTDQVNHWHRGSLLIPGS